MPPDPMMSKMNPAHPIHQHVPPTIIYRMIPFNGPAAYTSTATDPRDRYVVWAAALPHHRIVAFDLVHGIRSVEILCGYPEAGTQVVDQRAYQNCSKPDNLVLHYRHVVGMANGKLEHQFIEVYLPGDLANQYMRVSSLESERLGDWRVLGATFVEQDTVVTSVETPPPNETILDVINVQKLVATGGVCKWQASVKGWTDAPGSTPEEVIVSAIKHVTQPVKFVRLHHMPTGDLPADQKMDYHFPKQMSSEVFKQEYDGTFLPPDPVIVWTRHAPPGSPMFWNYRVWCPGVEGDETAILLEDAVKKLKAKLGLTGKKVPIVAATQWKAIDAPKTAGIDPLAPAKPVMHYWRVCDAEGTTLRYEFWAPINVGNRESYVSAQTMDDAVLDKFKGCQLIDKGFLFLRNEHSAVPAQNSVSNTIYCRRLKHPNGSSCYQAWLGNGPYYIEPTEHEAIKTIFKTYPFNLSHARLANLPEKDWPDGELPPQPSKSKLVTGVDVANGESFTVTGKITHHPDGTAEYSGGNVMPAPNQNVLPASGSAFQVSQWNNPIPMASGVNPGWAPTPNTPAQAKYILVERQERRKRKDCDEWVGPWAARPEGRMMPCEDGETPEEAVENLKMGHPWLDDLPYMVAPSADEEDAIRAAFWGPSKPHPIPVKHKTARPARASRSLDL